MNHFIVLTRKLSERPFTHKPPDEDILIGKPHILGQTGMGKGNAGALITEYLLEAGLPLTFIDLEGEGYSLKEICSSQLVVGRSANADREYSPAQMGRLAELSVEQGFSVVLDLSGYEDEEVFALIGPYLRSLWATCERVRTPYHLVLDEAHELIPEEGTTPVKSLLRRIAKRGRKHGLGVIAMSQETVSLDKKFLRQMNMRILLPVSYEADLKIYHTLIPGISLDILKSTMPAFLPGTGYVVFKHRPYLVHLLRRRTFDPSETPKLGDHRVTPTLQTKMVDPKRAERLWLAIAVATLWAVSVGGEADATLPVSSLEALPELHIARRTATGRSRPRMISCFARGLILIVGTLIRGDGLLLGRFLPEPWPSVPPALRKTNVKDKAYQPALELAS